MPSTKTIELDREKVISILNKVLESEIGSEIYIPCASKKSQNDTYTCVVRELKVMAEIDPADAETISHRAIFKDRRFWVVLTHVTPTLSSIFVKSKEGKITRVTI